MPADFSVVSFAQDTYVAKSDPDDQQKHVEVMTEPVIVPAGARLFTLKADRSQFPDMPDDRALKCRAEISFDGGKSWQLLASFSANGGDLKNEDGSVLTETWITVEMVRPELDNRVVRVTMTPMMDVKTTVGFVCK